LGVGSATLLVAFATNAPAFAQSREASAARKERKRLQARLLLALKDRVENSLRQSVISNGIDPHLKLYVFATKDGRHEVVATTVEAAAHVRHLVIEDDEGIVGLAARDQYTIVAKLASDKNAAIEVYDHGHGRIGLPPGFPKPLHPTNVRKSDFKARWIVAIPLWTRPSDGPGEVLGVVTVDSDQEDEPRFRSYDHLVKLERVAHEQEPRLQEWRSLANEIQRDDGTWSVPIGTPVKVKEASHGSRGAAQNTRTNKGRA
jgi:hypothetical protein